MTDKKNSFSKPLMIIIVSISAAVGATAGSTFVRTYFFSGQESVSFDEALIKISEEINKTTPRMVDKHTRLDATGVLPDRTILYKYTVIDIDPLPSKEDFIAAMKPHSTNAYQTFTDMAYFRENKVTLVYSYHTEDGKEYARYEISPDDFVPE